MDQKERWTLCGCRVFLTDNIYDVDSLLDDFIQARLINEDVAEEITVKPTRLGRKQTFLNQLPTWGPTAFKVFLKSLERNNYGHVVDKLNSELKISDNIDDRIQHAVTNHEVPSWLSDQVSRAKVSEKLLHILAQDLAPEMLFSLGIQLGQTHSRLQHIQAAHPYTASLQISTMLCDWRMSKGNQATVENLVSALSKTNVREEVYRDLVLEDLGVIGNQKSEIIHRMDSICTSGNPEQWV